MRLVARLEGGDDLIGLAQIIPGFGGEMVESLEGHEGRDERSQASERSHQGRLAHLLEGTLGRRRREEFRRDEVFAETVLNRSPQEPEEREQDEHGKDSRNLLKEPFHRD